MLYSGWRPIALTHYCDAESPPQDGTISPDGKTGRVRVSRRRWVASSTVTCTPPSSPCRRHPSLGMDVHAAGDKPSTALRFAAHKITQALCKGYLEKGWTVSGTTSADYRQLAIAVFAMILDGCSRKRPVAPVRNVRPKIASSETVLKGISTKTGRGTACEKRRGLGMFIKAGAAIYAEGDARNFSPSMAGSNTTIQAARLTQRTSWMLRKPAITHRHESERVETMAGIEASASRKVFRRTVALDGIRLRSKRAIPDSLAQRCRKTTRSTPFRPTPFKES